MEYPKLRYVDAFAVDAERGKMIGLRDPSGISQQIVLLSPDVFYLLQFFDGRHSVHDLRQKYVETFGKLLYEEQLKQILQNLDSNLFLDNNNFASQLKAIEQEFRDSSVRPAVHAGTSYESDPAALRKQLTSFFTAPSGPGLPDKPNGRAPKALVAPHIDIRAGGSCYAHAYKALVESEGADCFVILGTGHSGLQGLYSTIAKDFETPLGVARCDEVFVQLLQKNYPDILNCEVLPHKTEHVIEFQLVFLQHLLADRRDFTFVPLLCSFSYQMLTEPSLAREKRIVEEFSRALRQTIADRGKKVCLIASVDFCHVGPRYGDEKSPDDLFMSMVSRFDGDLIKNIEKLDAGAFCETVAGQQDRYRVCGFSSIYTMLNAITAERGELLDYSKAIVDTDQSAVTFASMAIY